MGVISGAIDFVTGSIKGLFGLAMDILSGIIGFFIDIMEPIFQAISDILNDFTISILQEFVNFFMVSIGSFLIIQNPRELPALRDLWFSSLTVYFLVFSVAILYYLIVIIVLSREDDSNFNQVVERMFGGAIIVFVSQPLFELAISLVNMFTIAFWPTSFQVGFAGGVLASAMSGMNVFVAFVFVIIFMPAFFFSTLAFYVMMSMRMVMIYAVYGMLPILLLLWIFRRGPMKYGYQFARKVFYTTAIILLFGIFAAMIMQVGMVMAADHGKDQNHDLNDGDASLGLETPDTSQQEAGSHGNLLSQCDEVNGNCNQGVQEMSEEEREDRREDLGDETEQDIRETDPISVDAIMAVVIFFAAMWLVIVGYTGVIMKFAVKGGPLNPLKGRMGRMAVGMAMSKGAKVGRRDSYGQGGDAEVATEDEDVSIRDDLISIGGKVRDRTGGMFQSVGDEVGEETPSGQAFSSVGETLSETSISETFSESAVGSSRLANAAKIFGKAVVEDDPYKSFGIVADGMRRSDLLDPERNPADREDIPHPDGRYGRHSTVNPGDEYEPYGDKSLSEAYGNSSPESYPDTQVGEALANQGVDYDWAVQEAEAIAEDTPYSTQQVLNQLETEVAAGYTVDEAIERASQKAPEGGLRDEFAGRDWRAQGANAEEYRESADRFDWAVEYNSELFSGSTHKVLDGFDTLEVGGREQLRSVYSEAVAEVAGDFEGEKLTEIGADFESFESMYEHQRSVGMNHEQALYSAVESVVNQDARPITGEFVLDDEVADGLDIEPVDEKLKLDGAIRRERVTEGIGVGQRNPMYRYEFRDRDDVYVQAYDEIDDLTAEQSYELSHRSRVAGRVVNELEERSDVDVTPDTHYDVTNRVKRMESVGDWTLQEYAKKADDPDIDEESFVEAHAESNLAGVVDSNERNFVVNKYGEVSRVDVDAAGRGVVEARQANNAAAEEQARKLGLDVSTGDIDQKTEELANRANENMDEFIEDAKRAIVDDVSVADAEQTESKFANDVGNAEAIAEAIRDNVERVARFGIE